MPKRSRLNGRQVSGETTRRASQALRLPRQKNASWPPVSATSDIPLRTNQYAWPMAWFDDEQAVLRLNTGPCNPNSSEILLAPALPMTFGTIIGWLRFFFSA